MSVDGLVKVMQEFGRGSPMTIEPPPFDLAGIKPPPGEMDGRGKFSPNLYFWMLRKWKRRFGDRGLERPPKVYRGGSDIFPRTNDVLYIGEMSDDGWFHGARLMRVMANGARTEIWAFTPAHAGRLGLKPLTNFWGAYRRIGRCAIDKAHTQMFLNDDARWAVKGKVRACTWCGKHKQRLQVRTHTKRVVTKKWISV